MGSEQFATGMTSTDKAQLNRIETNTENIVSDYNGYIINNSGYKSVTFPFGVTTNVLTLTGAGYVDMMVFDMHNTVKLRMTIDGVLLTDFGSYANYFAGFAQEKDIQSDGTQPAIYSDGSTKLPFYFQQPANLEWDQKTKITSEYATIWLSQPIYFNTELKIDFYNSNTVDVTGNYRYKIGVKA